MPLATGYPVTKRIYSSVFFIAMLYTVEQRVLGLGAPNRS